MKMQTVTVVSALLLASGSTLVRADNAPFINGSCLFGNVQANATTFGRLVTRLDIVNTAGTTTRMSANAAAIVTSVAAAQSPLPVFPDSTCYSLSSDAIPSLPGFMTGAAVYQQPPWPATINSFSLNAAGTTSQTTSGSAIDDVAELVTHQAFSNWKGDIYGDVAHGCAGFRRYSHSSLGASARLRSRHRLANTKGAETIRLTIDVPALSGFSARTSTHGVWPPAEEPTCVFKCLNTAHPAVAGVSQSSCIVVRILDVNGALLDEHKVGVLHYSWAGPNGALPIVSWQTNGLVANPATFATNPTLGQSETLLPDPTCQLSYIHSTSLPLGQLVFAIPSPGEETYDVAVEIVHQSAPDLNVTPWLSSLGDAASIFPPNIRNFHWQGLARDLTLGSLGSPTCISAFGPRIPPVPNPTPNPCPADVAGPGQSPIPDGELTADDIIVFIGWYFANDPRADVAGAGQTIGPDGQFTADDIIIFLNWFFEGC